MTEELKRFEVTLTKTGERTQHTFTWGKTRDQAYARIAEMLVQSPDLWAGWSFTVANEPTVSTARPTRYEVFEGTRSTRVDVMQPGYPVRTVYVHWFEYRYWDA